MPIALTGSDADKAKYARILADVNLARGSGFRENPSPEDLVKTAISLVGEGTEAEILDRLQKKAMHNLLAMNDGKLATSIHRDLFYMGYAKDWAYGQKSADERATQTEQALNSFYAKHPDCRNMSAKDVLDKVTDTLWYEDKQPQAAKNASDYGAITTYSEYGGGYDEGVYAGFDKEISAELQGSAEASFGGRDNIKKVQALLRERYPQAYDDNHKGTWQHGIESIPTDGTWTHHDQELLQRFIREENATHYKDNKFPPPTAMRWPDVQKEFGSRIFAGLINTQVNTAVTQLRATASTDRINPTSDGGINAGQISQMQLYLNTLGYYNGNHPPTGVWTTTDKQALQKWLDNSDHKESGFWKFWGWKDQYAGTTDNISADQFKKVLDKAAEEAKQKGVTSDLIPILTVSQPAQEPATPGLDRLNAPVVPPKPVVTQPANPAPVTTTPANPAQIENADAARLLAQMHLMNGYNGKYTGADADLNTALKAYAKAHPELKINADSDLTPQQARAVKAAVQSEWDNWVKNKDNAQKLKTIIDKGYEVGSADKQKDHAEVREMQIALLAMGGNLPSGVNGIYKGETAAALRAGMAEGGNYRKILDGAGVAHPAWTGGSTSTPSRPSGPKVDTSSGGFGDLIGEGGFITPLPRPVTPAPVVTTTQAVDAGRGPTTVMPTKYDQQPVVTAESVKTGGSVLTSYANGQFKPTLGEATSHFQSIANSGFLMDRGPYGARNLPGDKRYEVHEYLNAKDGRDAGQVFVMGPGGTYGAVYACNAGHLTYKGTYDLTPGSASYDAFVRLEQKAAQEQQRYNEKHGVQAGYGQVQSPGITPTTLGGVPNDSFAHVLQNSTPYIGAAAMLTMIMRR